MNSLHEELNAMRTLLELIQQEQSKLVEADVDGLQALTQEKAKAIALISQLADARHQLLAQAGLAPNDASMQTWIDQSGSPAQRKAWDELLSVTHTAKELNKINGLLITKQMARTQQALNVLQGNPQGNHFYGPNGQTTPAASSRRVVIG